MASFSERMTVLRNEKGLNKAEVARGTKLSRSAITSYENGTRDNPTNDIPKKLASFLDVLPLYSCNSPIDNSTSIIILHWDNVLRWAVADNLC